MGCHSKWSCSPNEFTTPQTQPLNPGLVRRLCSWPSSGRFNQVCWWEPARYNPARGKRSWFSEGIPDILHEKIRWKIRIIIIFSATDSWQVPLILSLWLLGWKRSPHNTSGYEWANINNDTWDMNGTYCVKPYLNICIIYIPQFG